MDLPDIVLASASSTSFFEPAVIRNDIYLSGDNVARSPALFAYLQEKKTLPLHAAEEKAGDTLSIRVVSIGSVEEEAEDVFDEEYSLLKWGKHLLKMNHQIVQHTMDGMLEAVARKNVDKFHKF